MQNPDYVQKSLRSWSARNTATIASVVFALASFPGLAATTYSGRATALQAANIRVGDTDSLPSSGGEQVAPNTSLTLPSTPALKLSLQALSAVTKGGDNKASSNAQISGVSVEVLPVVGPAILSLKASVVEAKTSAQCDAAGKAKVSGASVVTGLTINGKAVAVSGAPNQKINLVLGHVILNEQSGGGSSKSVNAIHIEVPALVNVILSSAESGIGCEAPTAQLPAPGSGEVIMSRPVAGQRSPSREGPRPTGSGKEEGSQPPFEPMQLPDQK